MTTITFMYNSRFRVCHAGHLLMRLNFLLTASNTLAGFAYVCLGLTAEPATGSALPIVFHISTEYDYRRGLHRRSIQRFVCNPKSPKTLTGSAEWGGEVY